MAIKLDVDLTPEDVSRLTSVDALAAFFQRLGYDTGKRTVIPAQAVGLDGNSDIQHIEMISEDAGQFLRVVFVRLRSVTAKARHLLVRSFGKQTQDYLLVLASDFEALEFVLIEKVRQPRKGAIGDVLIAPQAKVFVVPRRWPQAMLRIIRRLTFTAFDEAGAPDAILQYAKLMSVFDAAHYSGEYFQNRALFADHFLRHRLPEDPAWRVSPNESFTQVSQIMHRARESFGGKTEAIIRQELFEHVFGMLGFTLAPGSQPGVAGAQVGLDVKLDSQPRAAVPQVPQVPQTGAKAGEQVGEQVGLDVKLDTQPRAAVPHTGPQVESQVGLDVKLDSQPRAAVPQVPQVPQVGAQAGSDIGPCADYVLLSGEGQRRTVALTYCWERWLDGPDPSDVDAPAENPGAAVVSLLERGDADWVVVSNGKLWRLYSRVARSRSTNFYEVDLEDALLATGQTDPNEAFRYWWLFFREPAFAPTGDGKTCWLDEVVTGSREYAREVETELKRRVFYEVVPQLAAGFLEDRRGRLKMTTAPDEIELEQMREGTLTLLYRILFLLYAESRDLLPVRESAYYQISLKRLKEEISHIAGVAESQADEKIAAHYKRAATTLYDRLGELFAVMDGGDLERNRACNVPVYNGGLFRVQPQEEAGNVREAGIAEFLLKHKVPDVFLASALDRLARVPDNKTFGLAFVDYKSLGVRQLGSIYEGLLEFRLRIADSDLPPIAEKGRKRSTGLTAARGIRDRTGVRKGEPYLANDNSERKATGSYYTPDHIVQYIVEHTVGPVLERKTEELRVGFRAAEKTYHQKLSNAKADARLLWDWKLRHQRSIAKSKVPTEEEFRAYAMDMTYEQHRDLVEKLFNLRVLDPAMGSGHFLVEAVDYITDGLLNFLNAFPANPVTAAMERMRKDILESLRDQGIETDGLLERQLTDVHLIKRHVLKRCIYGVDLNPLAAELAKVSLWLDAFTIGAPLSFLDHHVRVGNSLIGATVPEVQEWLKEQETMLFGSRFAGLKLATAGMTAIAAMPDATASQVKSSQSQFRQASGALAPFRRILDAYLMQWFVPKELPTAKGKNIGKTLLDFVIAPEAKEFFDAATDQQLRAALAKLIPEDRQLAEAILAVAVQRRFFHWELEFPEAFYAARQGTAQVIERMENPGFDAVVGNPPYVRQEALKADKAYLAGAFVRTFDAANDLYVYFMEREIEILRSGGLMGMIVANKWLRAGYGLKVRNFLRRKAVVESIVDFGHSPIFPDADTFPCVPIFSRRDKVLAQGEELPGNETFAACMFPRDGYRVDMAIGPYVMTHRSVIPSGLLREAGWSLEDPRVQRLLERIRDTGVPLKEFCGGKLYRGPVTGLNEAFFIDGATRQRLIAEDKRSAEIIKPLLRGRDIDRWRPRVSDGHIIFARRGIEIERYPAIKRHLARFREQLEPRPADWDGARKGAWPGRAPGDYAWYELQASPGEDFARAMFGRKILYQEIQFHCWFSLETEGACINNKVFMLPTDDPALLGVLCSSLMWWFLTRTLPHMKDEALCPAGFVMENVRVTTGTGGKREEIRAAVEPLLRLSDELHRWQNDFTVEACAAVGAKGPDGRVLNWLRDPPAVFSARLTGLGGGSGLSAGLAGKLVALHQRGRKRYMDLLSKQLEMERRLAVLVEDAYGLTPEERELMRATRPVRDPLDVLEAKIGGKMDAVGEEA